MELKEQEGLNDIQSEEEIVVEEEVPTDEGIDSVDGNEEPEDENQGDSFKSKYIAERTKRKELEKQLKKGKEGTTELSTYDSLISQGIDAGLAKTLSNAISKSGKESADLKFTVEMLRVSKNPEFADIEAYSDEVKEFVEKGLTIEQAYYAATGGVKTEKNTRTEIKRELETKLKNQRTKAQILDIDTTSTAVEKNNKGLKYTREELATAKEVGLSIEEYKALQNIETVEAYEEFNKKHVKKN